MNHKRRKPRKNVRCKLCTDSRDYTGTDRLKRKKEVDKTIQDSLEMSPFWQSVERASQVVSQWPAWKQAGVLSRPLPESVAPPASHPIRDGLEKKHEDMDSSR